MQPRRISTTSQSRCTSKIQELQEKSIIVALLNEIKKKTLKMLLFRQPDRGGGSVTPGLITLCNILPNCFPCIKIAVNSFQIDSDVTSRGVNLFCRSFTAKLSFFLFPINFPLRLRTAFKIAICGSFQRLSPSLSSSIIIVTIIIAIDYY